MATKPLIKIFYPGKTAMEPMPALRTIVYSGTSPSSKRSCLLWNLCQAIGKSSCLPSNRAGLPWNLSQL
jgi:hypothetical protein